MHSPTSVLQAHPGRPRVAAPVQCWYDHDFGCKPALPQCPAQAGDGYQHERRHEAQDGATLPWTSHDQEWLLDPCPEAAS